MKDLLDTDHLTILQTRRGHEYQRLSSRIGQTNLDIVGVFIVSFHEQVLGCQTYLVKAKPAVDLVRGYYLLAEVIDQFTELPVVPFDHACAVTLSELQKQRVRAGSMDLRIAAVALTNGITVLTRNKRHFARVPGLQIEDWTS